jgi:hypothetical protein
MKRKKKTHSPNTLLERVFRITRKYNRIDLSGSVAIINGEASEENFETEIFQVTFSTGKQNNKRQYSIFMSPSEVISEKEILNLKKTLGIEISGDGSSFKIDHFERDFKLSFDLKNSIAIDSLGVKKGVIYFKKRESTRREVQLPYRKRTRKKPSFEQN